jgi:hypothetical protein
MKYIVPIVIFNFDKDFKSSFFSHFFVVVYKICTLNVDEIGGLLFLPNLSVCVMSLNILDRSPGK